MLKRFYVLEKFDQELVERYLERAKGKSFWGWGMIAESSGVCWFLAKLGLSGDPHYKDGLSQLKDSQSRDGMIWDSAPMQRFFEHWSYWSQTQITRKN
ncbi:MAG: hypothetical protein U9Q68_02365 [Euryarchaeota archaeon]|nr:hypothetical protein [Euryarchaeota archaeon]